MRGIMFTVDAAIALILVLSALGLFTLLSFETSSEELTYQQLHFDAQDIIQVMSVLKVSDVLDTAVISDLFNTGRLIEAHKNKSIMDVIAEFWSGNTSKNKSIAKNITKELFSSFVPDNLDWAFLIDKDVLFNSSRMPDSGDMVVSRRFASGFMESRPTTGCYARASVQAVKGKQDSSYAFFGGFVGQGNITAVIRDIPGDANVSEIYMEMNIPSNFTLYLNDFNCGSFITRGPGMNVSNFSITKSSNPSCINAIRKGGINVFYINFSSNNITKHYIGGGFIRVSYSTKRLINPAPNISKYYFPGINGLINLYSSFYVPGDIQSMNIHLEFFNNYTTYLRIAGQQVMSTSGSKSTQNVNISNTVLSSLLNYSELSSKTIPIRMGIVAIGEAGTGDSDVVLITDLSGSMNWCIDSNSHCSSPNRRIDLAKDLDKQFVNIILSTPGNRVALVTYSNNAYKRTNLTDNETYLNNTIDGFSASGATCIACAIREARMILQNESNSSRQKFIVVMSDGLANMRVDTSRINRTTCCTYGYWWFPSYYCPSPFCGRNFVSRCGSTYDSTASQQAINDACYAHSVTNATIYSVGFGPIQSCREGNYTLRQIAECGNGSFFASDNATELEEIYQLLANTILYQSYKKQITEVTGNISTWLSNNSYIEFSYAPESQITAYGEVSFAQESKRFASCNSSLFIPAGIKVSDLKALTYSAAYWADRLILNNKNHSDFSVYNLADYGPSYSYLGDPYVIHVPDTVINQNDSNNFSLRLGVSPSNSSDNCSGKDKFVYIVRLSAIASSQGLFPDCFGYNVSVYYDTDHDGVADGSLYVPIGEDLPGFVRTPVDVEDLNTSGNGIANAFASLLEQLNYFVSGSNSGPAGSQNNPIDIEITPEVKFSVNVVGGVPYMWGPAKLEVVIWRKQ